MRGLKGGAWRGGPTANGHLPATAGRCGVAEADGSPEAHERCRCALGIQHGGTYRRTRGCRPAADLSAAGAGATRVGHWWWCGPTVSRHAATSSGRADGVSEPAQGGPTLGRCGRPVDLAVFLGAARRVSLGCCCALGALAWSLRTAGCAGAEGAAGVGGEGALRDRR